MAATTYASPEALWGTALPKLWNASGTRRALFGDAALFLFLLAQCFDGVLTYVGVVTYGTGIEANPLIATLIGYFGAATALMTAKGIAAGLGIALHLGGVHLPVALLTGFYLVVAIVPWVMILFPGTVA